MPQSLLAGVNPPNAACVAVLVACAQPASMPAFGSLSPAEVGDAGSPVVGVLVLVRTSQVRCQL